MLSELNGTESFTSKDASESADPPSGAHVPRILMAEDNAINQRVGRLILQRAGFLIEVVEDGHQALEAHREKPYDLILMDCQMPIMDGFEACRQIRTLSERQPIIVAVTANALLGERERCLDAGMDDYLSKPFQAEQLIGVVQKWVGTRTQAAAPVVGRLPAPDQQEHEEQHPEEVQVVPEDAHSASNGARLHAVLGTASGLVRSHQKED